LGFTGSTSSNLIDLHSELSPVRKKSWEHDYVNHDVAPQVEKVENGNDVFDMRKFLPLLVTWQLNEPIFTFRTIFDHPDCWCHKPVPPETAAGARTLVPWPHQQKRG